MSPFQLDIYLYLQYQHLKTINSWTCQRCHLVCPTLIPSKTAAQEWVSYLDCHASGLLTNSHQLCYISYSSCCSFWSIYHREYSVDNTSFPRLKTIAFWRGERIKSVRLTTCLHVMSYTSHFVAAEGKLRRGFLSMLSFPMWYNLTGQSRSAWDSNLCPKPCSQAWYRYGSILGHGGLYTS